MGHAVVTPTGERGRAPQGSGPLLFARFAHAAAVGEQAAASAPPGGDVHGALLGTYLARGVVDGRLAEVESEFAGAWPYLEVIAEATGIDRLDRRVVEAYWIGNPLVEQVPPAALHRMLSAWARTVGVPSPEVVDAVATFGVAHHSCHVLCVLPWSRLAADERRAPPAPGRARRLPGALGARAQRRRRPGHGAGAAAGVARTAPGLRRPPRRARAGRGGRPRGGRGPARGRVGRGALGPRLRAPHRPPGPQGCSPTRSRRWRWCPALTGGG